MTSTRELVVQVVSLAGGTITGRVRLQKIFHLLSKKGLGAELPFSYHHFGPYSRVVDDAVASAKAFNGLREVPQRRALDGAPFSVFKLDEENLDRPTSRLGGIAVEEAKRLIGDMQAVSSTVIGLAATIHWLRHVEMVADWRTELRRRKGVKTQGGRMEQALELLNRLGLEGIPRRH